MLQEKARTLYNMQDLISLPLYHITDRDANIVKALEFAQNEYRSFKSEFIRVSETLGFDGTSKAHVDKILQEIFKDKPVQVILF